jgi:putative radical SAM enzyme (TIGR03279 family)
MLLESIDGNPINDVLDYMFYADEDENLQGLEFETFLMDEKRCCGNRCIFCFIDQNPPNMRKTVYFKDDDSRLSFLQGNYITLTNLNKRDVERILQMRTPVNVSVHTTNPDLRVKMLGNPNGGKSLSALRRFAAAGIDMNCQIVLCPSVNDGDELIRTLDDLTVLESVRSIAVVPAGVTKFREGLYPLRRFTQSQAADIIKIVDGYDNVYCADELYLTADIEIPRCEHYGDFPQYENGVGMWAYMRDCELPKITAKMQAKDSTIVTGTAALPLIESLVKPFENVRVFAVRNDFFGETVTVSGLLTGGDIIAQLIVHKNDLGEQLLIGANTLNCDGLFLDDTTPEQIQNALGVAVRIVETDCRSLFDALRY